MEKTIYERLLAAQMDIGAIKRDSTNPFFHSKYFDINAILAEVKPILNKHGLIIVQGLQVIEGKNGLSTGIINAEDGKLLLESSILLPEGLDPQKTGSAITYFRRYALQSLLALEAEDDDGNIASGKKAKAEPVKDKFFDNIEPTDEEIITWKDLLESSRTVKEAQTNWKKIPPMVQEKLAQVKEQVKEKLSKLNSDGSQTPNFDK